MKKFHVCKRKSKIVSSRGYNTKHIYFKLYQVKCFLSLNVYSGNLKQKKYMVEAEMSF